MHKQLLRRCEIFQVQCYKLAINLLKTRVDQWFFWAVKSGSAGFWGIRGSNLRGFGTVITFTTWQVAQCIWCKLSCIYGGNKARWGPFIIFQSFYPFFCFFTWQPLSLLFLVSAPRCLNETCCPFPPSRGIEPGQINIVLNQVQYYIFLASLWVMIKSQNLYVPACYKPVQLFKILIIILLLKNLLTLLRVILFNFICWKYIFISIE